MAGKWIRRWQDLKLGAVPLEKLLSQFQAGNRAKGLSEATIHWYDRMLGEFIRFSDSAKLEDLDDQAAIAFLGAQRARKSRLGKPLSSQTIHGGYRALKAFSSWLYREEFTETDRLAGLPAPKRQKKLIEPLTREEVLRWCPSATGSVFHPDRP
jgi:site-specific recombinase XerD